MKLEPDSATAHYNLACFLSTHGPEFAVAAYKQAIDLDPEYPDAHLNLGLTYADHGRLEEAVAELQTAIELDPSDAFPRHELAALLMDEGDYRGAIAQLPEVVRLEPEDFEAHLDLGICYAQRVLRRGGAGSSRPKGSTPRISCFTTTSPHPTRWREGRIGGDG